MIDTEIETPATERERRLATQIVAGKRHVVLRELIAYLGDADRQRGLSALERRIAEAAHARIRKEWFDHTAE